MTTEELRKEFDIKETSDGTVITRWCGKGSQCVIPSGMGIIGIGERAFWKCDNLTSITLPDGVTSIGENAFQGCKGLTEITIPNGVSWSAVKTWSIYTTTSSTP